MIISAAGGEEEYNFLNWRVASYYLPTRDIWVLGDDRSSAPVSQWTRLVRGRRMVDRTGDDALQIPVPAGGRIIWLMERDTPFVRELSRLFPVGRGRYVLYTDLRPEIGRFTVRGFEFVPN
ncbi:MAG: hypothetical protein HYU27_02655 [Acidobacteria bacterium]|nr:hypothetical protein [Acidobacteriota bacterium]